MFRPGKAGAPSAEASLQHVPMMLQTEDHFTTLTHVAGALLYLHGQKPQLDTVAGVTGDCFALQLSTDRPAVGRVCVDETLPAALGDLGLSVQFVAEIIPPDSQMRVFTLIRAGLRNYRPSLACGGWPAYPSGDRDRSWGIVHLFDSDRAVFIGSTVREMRTERMLAHDVAWPHAESDPCAVYLVERWREPESRDGKLARRALLRGLRLLTGEGGAAGPADITRFVEWLRVAEDISQGATVGSYPYPLRASLRCQFEAIGRFVEQLGEAVPRKKWAARAQVVEVARSAAELLAAGEPERAFPRNHARGAAAGQLPWLEGGWEELARDLDDPRGEARQREIAAFEALAERHAVLVEALDALVAR